MEDLALKRNFDVMLGKKEKDESDDEDNSKKPKQDLCGLSESASVETYKNHIYFYSSVSKKSCLNLNVELRKISQHIIDNGRNLLNKDNSDLRSLLSSVDGER